MAKLNVIYSAIITLSPLVITSKIPRNPVPFLILSQGPASDLQRTPCWILLSVLTFENIYSHFFINDFLKVTIFLKPLPLFSALQYCDCSSTHTYKYMYCVHVYICTLCIEKHTYFMNITHLYTYNTHIKYLQNTHLHSHILFLKLY